MWLLELPCTKVRQLNISTKIRILNLGLHIGYNHYRVGTKTIAVEPRDVIQLSMGPQKLNN